jgi:hypothetical protein
MSISPIIQKRLENQGFMVCKENHTFVRVVPWLRFTPALGGMLIGLRTALASPGLLLTLVPITILGASLPVHPADLIYNYGLRYLTGTPPLPPNPTPRRFSFGVVAVWLIATAWAFLAGATTVGYVLGAALTVMPAINVTVSHFCLLSLIYHGFFDHPSVKPD